MMDCENCGMWIFESKGILYHWINCRIKCFDGKEAKGVVEAKNEF